jgi:carbon-monoxide dehydrogenase large subunit
MSTLAERLPFVGARITRVEDERLLRGEGRYVADQGLAAAAECVIVRSQVAHATIRGVDVDAARAAPGVIAVVTGDDLPEIGSMPHFHTWAPEVPRFPLATGRVRYVGQPIAAVVAEDRYVGEDAAELVVADLEERPPVASMEQALREDAPLVYEEWGHNLMVDLGGEDPQVTRLLEAHTVVRGRFAMPRHFAVPMETRCVAAEHRSGRFTIWSTSQIPHIARTTIAATLGVAERDVRVIAPDIGGGFGGKAGVYPEEVLVPWLARSLGRPVRFVEDRAEHMVASAHARENVHEVEAAVDEDGRILAIRVRLAYDVGTQQIFPLTLTPSMTGWAVMTGGYRIEHADSRIRNVVTNKTPAGAYRGFGVGEAMFAMERMVDLAAKAVGVDPAEARRKMLLRPEDLPWTTPTGVRLDTGSHLAAFDRCVELTTAAGERARERLGDVPTIRIGTGYASYVEPTVPTWFGTTGRWTAYDSARVTVDPGGGITVAVGVQTMGQGVETLVATVAAGMLGVGLEDVRVVRGDTDLAPYGLGSWGSRTAAVAAGAILVAATEVRDKAMRIAAHLLEADPNDLVSEKGRIHVRGSDEAGVTWADVGRTASVRAVDMPPGEDPGLGATASYDPPFIDHEPDDEGRMNACSTYANASHGAVVKLDVETGEIEIVDYVVVHDCGTVINPAIVEGQVHGAVAQGIGGALYEAMPYSDDGQPLATTFMDYLVPTASEIPSMTLDHFETPAEGTPLGVKGIGEGGIVGPAAAIGNAVSDALADLGVELTETPFSPVSVRRAIREATRDA